MTLRRVTAGEEPTRHLPIAWARSPGQHHRPLGEQVVADLHLGKKRERIVAESFKLAHALVNHLADHEPEYALF